MGAVDPLPKQPTNADLAKGLMQIHQCLDEHRQETRKSIDVHRVETSTQFGIVDSKIEAAFGNILTLNKAFGLSKDDKIKKPIALMSQAELLWKGGSALSGLFFLYKFLDFTAPQFWQYLVALHKFVIK